MRKTGKKVVKGSIYRTGRNGSMTYFKSVNQAMKRKGLTNFVVNEGVNRIGSLKIRIYKKIGDKWISIIESFTASGKVLILNG